MMPERKTSQVQEELDCHSIISIDYNELPAVEYCQLVESYN